MEVRERIWSHIFIASLPTELWVRQRTFGTFSRQLSTSEQECVSHVALALEGGWALSNGLTKFFPDWCFGFCKRLYRRMFVYLHWLKLNKSVVILHWRTFTCRYVLAMKTDMFLYQRTIGWFFYTMFLEISGIKSFHHFCALSKRPDIVIMQRFCNSETVELNFNKSQCPSLLAPITVIKGMDNKENISV